MIFRSVLCLILVCFSSAQALAFFLPSLVWYYMAESHFPFASTVRKSSDDEIAVNLEKRQKLIKAIYRFGAFYRKSTNTQLLCSVLTYFSNSQGCKLGFARIWNIGNNFLSFPSIFGIDSLRMIFRSVLCLILVCFSSAQALAFFLPSLVWYYMAESHFPFASTVRKSSDDEIAVNLEKRQKLIKAICRSLHWYV